MGALLTVTQILLHIWMHIPVAMWSFGIYKPGYHAATFNGDKLQSRLYWLYHGVPGTRQSCHCHVKSWDSVEKNKTFGSSMIWTKPCPDSADPVPEPLTTCVTPQSAEVGCQRPVI